MLHWTGIYGYFRENHIFYFSMLLPAREGNSANQSNYWECEDNMSTVESIDIIPGKKEGKFPLLL